MKRVIIAVAAFALMIVQPVGAGEPSKSDAPGGGLFMTGQRLSEICNGKTGNDLPNTFAGGTCLGYINGAAELWMLIGDICYNHVTMGELSDVVVKYINENPEEMRRHTAIVLVGMALKGTYPVTVTCRQQIGAPKP
jgi:hypothetical protein